MSTSTESLFWARGGEYVKGGRHRSPVASPEELRCAQRTAEGGCPHIARLLLFMAAWFRDYDALRAGAGDIADHSQVAIKANGRAEWPGRFPTVAPPQAAQQARQLNEAEILKVDDIALI